MALLLCARCFSCHLFDDLCDTYIKKHASQVAEQVLAIPVTHFFFFRLTVVGFSPHGTVTKCQSLSED